MLNMAAFGAGLAVYAVALAIIGFYHGEAPGQLKVIFARLRGEKPGPKKHWWHSDDGQLSKKQRIVLMLLAAGVMFIVGTLFLRKVWIGLLLAGASPLYPLFVEQTLRRKRRELVNTQFGLALRAMASSLRAGASLKTAVEQSTIDLKRMLAGQRSTPMVAELERVSLDMDLGLSLEQALIRLRDRLSMEDVTDFVRAVLICRTRGGNIAAVMAATAEIIEDKINVRQQILTLTAGKRMEGNMFTCAPPLMITILSLTQPEYLAPLYQNLIGQLLMVAAVICLVAAFFIGRRLVQIDV